MKFHIFLIFFVILVSLTTSVAYSDNVPKWVKNTAGWWATDEISETEFVNAIEFLVKEGVINIHLCNETEDHDRNNIPDALEQYSTLRTYTDKDWKNCSFPLDLSNHAFVNVDFTNADLSNTTLFNASFYYSIFANTNFSDSNMKGVTFFKSNLINTDFKNVDFAPDTWEEPWFIFTYYTKSDEPGLTVGYSCYIVPCTYHERAAPSDMVMKDATLIESISNYPREKDRDPLNLVNVDLIDDKSDIRTIWRHVTDFTSSNIVNSSFTNSDLTHTVFYETTIQNVDFSDAKMSSADIISANLSDVKFTEDIYFEADNSMKSLTIPEENYKNEFVKLYLEKISNPKGIDLDIRFVDALDDIPINYAMGSIIHKEKLYVADTDNHRISVYDSNTLEPLIKFTSPRQHYCPGVNAFTTEKSNCPTEIRNLPTSLAILNEKIFVAYGFQDDIQIFDLNGNFITVFGNTGKQIGEFNEPYRLIAGNNELYVADSQNNRIQVFNSDGEFLRQFTTSPDLITENSVPYDLEILDNRIFVADSKRSSILIFDLNGNYLEELSIRSGFPSLSITSVSIYDDLLYVTDQENDAIIVLDLDGNLIMNVGKTGDHYGEFKSPYHLTIDEGRMFVSDAKNYRIQIFDIEKIS